MEPATTATGIIANVAGIMNSLFSSKPKRTRDENLNTPSLPVPMRIDQNLQPQELYEGESDTHYREALGKCMGILDETLIFWEVVGDQYTGSNVRGRWETFFQHGERLGEAERVQFWTVGRDKKHAHPTEVIVCKSERVRQKILSRFDSDESVQRFSSKLGLLVLESRPDFFAVKPDEPLSDPPTRVWSIRRRDNDVLDEYTTPPVLLATNETKEVPPYRVTFPSLTGDGWETSTIGGILEAEDSTFGVIVPASLDADSDIESVDSLESRIPSRFKTIPPADSSVIMPKEPEASTLTQVPKSSSETSTLVAGTPLGFVRGYRKSPGSWPIVKLKDAVGMVNTVEVPDGFGETFNLTKFADPDPENLVWILTSTYGIQEGRLIRQETNRPLPGSEVDWKWCIKTPRSIRKCMHHHKGLFIFLLADIAQAGRTAVLGL
jgi:hypothetical protein